MLGIDVFWMRIEEVAWVPWANYLVLCVCVCVCVCVNIAIYMLKFIFY